MPPIFLLIVKIAFLIVLYLFVARAVRAVLLDVYGPRADKPPGRRKQRNRQQSAPRPARTSRKMPRELVVNDLDGKRNVPLRDSVTIGRAASCDLVVLSMPTRTSGG